MFNPLPPNDDKFTPEFKKPDASAPPDPAPPGKRDDDDRRRYPAAEDDYDDDYEGPSRYPQRSRSSGDVGEQRRLMGSLAAYLTVFGVLGLLGGCLLCLAGLGALGGGGAGGPGPGTGGLAGLIQGGVFAVIGLLTLAAGGQFRSAANSNDPTGQPLTAALRSLCTVYLFQIILIVLGVILVVVVVALMVAAAPRHPMF